MVTNSQFIRKSTMGEFFAFMYGCAVQRRASNMVEARQAKEQGKPELAKLCVSFAREAHRTAAEYRRNYSRFSPGRQ